MGLVAKVDDRTVNLAFELLGKEALPATSRALKDAAASTRAQTVDLVRQHLTLKASTIRDAIRVPRTVSKGPDGLSADIRISGRPVPLGEFRARQTAKGVTVQVKQGRARALIPGAFIPQLASGHKGVFFRARAVKIATTRGHKHRADAFAAVARGITARVGRLPVEELFSTTVKDAIDSQLILRELLAYASDRFIVELRHELKYRLDRRVKASRRAAARGIFG